MRTLLKFAGNINRIKICIVYLNPRYKNSVLNISSKSVNKFEILKLLIMEFSLMKWKVGICWYR